MLPGGSTKTIWPPSREWDTRGEEPYGIAGCTTERPPCPPLRNLSPLQAGDTFSWADITLEIIALPGSGKRSIGFYWRTTGALFSGDLLHAGGYLVNLYDLERGYGILNGYQQLLASVQHVAGLAPKLQLPSTGPLITDVAGDLARLRENIEQHVFQGPVRRSDRVYAMTNYKPKREFGRYREVAPGIYQNNNAGNMVLFVDAQGRGCLVDPGPCIWESWEDSVAAMHADLDLLEQETGLRSIELVLITHYHGDHIQFCDLLRERYGATIAATADVADIMERPEDFRYPCVLDWYGFPFTTIAVDKRLTYEQLITWHDTTITPIWTPGHCGAHTGFLIPWGEYRTVCTGDTLQYGDGPLGAGLPIIYNASPWPAQSQLVTAQRLAQARPNLILCGHSFSCFDEDGAIVKDWLAVYQQAIQNTTKLLADGNLKRAMTPANLYINEEETRG